MQQERLYIECNSCFFLIQLAKPVYCVCELIWNLSSSGEVRLLVMPGQRMGKPPTHAAHIYTCPSLFGYQYSFENMLYYLFCICKIKLSYCNYTLVKINSSYSNALSSDVRTTQTNTGARALIPDTQLNAYDPSRDVCFKLFKNLQTINGQILTENNYFILLST